MAAASSFVFLYHAALYIFWNILLAYMNVSSKTWILSTIYELFGELCVCVLFGILHLLCVPVVLLDLGRLRE